MPAPPTVLAADVGGTNCRLALFEGTQALRSRTVPTTTGTFLDAVQGFVGPTGIGAACVAVAGPVVQGRATLTNHSWTFDERRLSRALGTPVTVINDFSAATRGVPTLGPGDARSLAGPAPDPSGAVVALGPGTGLGLGWMVPTGDGWHVAASEGGHQDLAPHDPWEADLWRWLHDRHGHVSWERVLCGKGLVALHDFAVRQGLAGLPTPTPAAIGTSPAPACAEARQRFGRLLGHFAGNCALAHLPAGGVWICGGIPPRLSQPAFDASVADAFVDKGRFSGLLAGIPLALVTVDDLGLRGAAATARGNVRCP